MGKVADIGILVGIGLPTLIFVLSAIPAWITHCATQIARLIDGHGDTFINALVLVIGAVFAPAGVIHGWLIWFGLA